MCVISSDLPQVVDRTEYLNCENIEVLKGIFRQCFKMKDSKYQDYNSVSARPITLNSFPTVYQTKIKINQDNTSLSKKKLRKIINRIVNEKGLMLNLDRKNEINYLVNVVIREIQGKASPEIIREIIIKIIKRKEKYLEKKQKHSVRNNFEITFAQEYIFNKFCSDCKNVGIKTKSGCYTIELCEKHKDDFEAIKQMLEDDAKNYCPACNTLGLYQDNYWQCPDDDCRVVRFFTG